MQRRHLVINKTEQKSPLRCTRAIKKCLQDSVAGKVLLFFLRNWHKQVPLKQGSKQEELRDPAAGLQSHWDDGDGAGQLTSPGWWHRWIGAAGWTGWDGEDREVSCRPERSRNAQGTDQGQRMSRLSACGSGLAGQQTQEVVVGVCYRLPAQK